MQMLGFVPHEPDINSYRSRSGAPRTEMSTDVSVQRRITNVQLDVHPIERALVISYELDCVISDKNDVANDTAFLQRTVRIKNLAAVSIHSSGSNSFECQPRLSDVLL